MSTTMDTKVEAEKRVDVEVSFLTPGRTVDPLFTIRYTIGITPGVAFITNGAIHADKWGEVCKWVAGDWENTVKPAYPKETEHKMITIRPRIYIRHGIPGASCCVHPKKNTPIGDYQPVDGDTVLVYAAIEDDPKCKQLIELAKKQSDQTTGGWLVFGTFVCWMILMIALGMRK